MVIAIGQPETLGVDQGARLEICEAPKPEGAWAGRRVLMLGARPAFELSYWCGTCPFVFERLEGANETLSLDAVQAALNGGLDDLDRAVIEAFGAILPCGTYLPMLLEIEPRRTLPGAAGDYFSEEQVSTWGMPAFWGIPQTPRTPYYRTFETAVDADAHLYEFVVPMVPPTWNEPERVAKYRAQFETTSLPTAVALSTLDVCRPEMAHDATDDHVHWCLTHFLLDGHHKLQAAADAGLPLRLLSLVTVDGSLAGPWDVDTLPAKIAAIPDIRSRPRSARPAVAGAPEPT